jgi:hypothetical protein
MGGAESDFSRGGFISVAVRVKGIKLSRSETILIILWVIKVPRLIKILARCRTR